MNNVTLIARERGKVVSRRDGHNVFVDVGRQYLSELIAFTTIGPDTPKVTDRVKHMGFGIGGNEQSEPAVGSPPFSTTYPVGGDPNVTTGDEHDESFPQKPVGSSQGIFDTLERPVRIAGGFLAYPGEPGDQWLSSASSPNFITTHPSLYSTRFHAFFNGATDFLYGPYTTMPLSEAGLFASDATTLGVPFNTLIAYHTFATIRISSLTELEVIWDVNF